jgi:aspartate/methionine/tyrosine aminotransferase
MLRVADFLDLELAPIERPPHNRCRIDFDVVADALAAGARAVFITDLHNPSGLLCPVEEMGELARLTASHGAHLIVDEVYRDYAVINRGAPLATAATLSEHILVTNSLTKVYGLGTLRLGWLLAAPKTIEKARDLFDHLAVVNPSPSQQLGTAAFEHLDRLAKRPAELYRRGYPVYQAWVDSRDDVLDYGNDGALFAFPRIAGLDDTGPLCRLLAQEYDTSVVPGAFFRAPQHVRISFTLEPEDLTEGLDRIGRALGRIRRDRSSQ